MKQPVDKEPRERTAPRLALQRKEAAEALGIGVDTFDRHVRAPLPVVYVGSVRLYPLPALEGWLASNASGTINAIGRWAAPREQPAPGTRRRSSRARQA